MTNKLQLTADITEIRRALSILIRDADQVFEVRALDVKDPRGFSYELSGYFDDQDKAAAEIAKVTGAAGIYITLNQIDPALLARSANHLGKAKKGQATSDTHVKRRVWLLIDLDPQRPSGVSATDEEHHAALLKTQAVRRWLSLQGWPDPVMADSGNGGHLLYAIDLPAKDDHLIENVLKAIALYHDDDRIKIDLSVFNPARISKLYGTKVSKGDSTKDRPHRLAHLLEVPSAIEIVTVDQLKALAKSLPTPPESPARNPGTLKDFDLAQWIGDHKLSVNDPREWQGGKAWIFDVCPWNSDHTDRSAFIVQFASGPIAAGCHHNSCAGKKWPDLRDTIEPGWRDKRNGQRSNVPAMPDGPDPVDDTPGQPAAAAATPAKPKPERKPPTKSAAYITALTDAGYSFRFNELVQDIEVNGAPLTDNLAAEIRCKMRDFTFSDMRALEDAYTSHALRNAYHPIKDFFNGLKWDGLGHIEQLGTFLVDSHPPFANGDKVARRLLRRWLIGAVGKVLDQIQTPMLVLEGRQNLGKSHFIAWLASPMPAYFVEGPIAPDDKDCKVRLMSRWLWEVSELGATTRRADVEALKSFVTLRDVTVRRPYGRRDVHGPAVCNLIGTLNDTGAGFLNDTTGSRRFLTLALTDLHWDYRKFVDIRQVWAEAVAAYRAGESSYLTPEERDKQAEINAGFTAVDPVEDLITTRFVIDPKRQDWITPSADILRMIDETLRGTSTAHARSIAAYLKTRGIVSSRPYVGGHPVRGYRGIRPLTDFETNKLQTAVKDAQQDGGSG